MRAAESSAPTRFDVYLNRAIVGSGFHTRPKKITQKITSGALPDATGLNEIFNRANVGNAYMRSVKFCSCFGGTDVSVPYAAAMKTRYIFGMPRAAFPTTEDMNLHLFLNW